MLTLMRVPYDQPKNVPVQEVAISIKEIIDSRRETNSSWEGLGRSEVLAEERVFYAAKEASSGGSKDKSKDFIEAYK